MPDHARSSSPAVQAQLDRLWALSPGADILGLARITELLARLGNPHHKLPPVFHVAGTNGKGSTCAYLRAMIEAAGLTCHVYTSPHLVRFNERIRLGGRLIDDDPLAALLAEVLDTGSDIGASFFEVTTAAAFLAFARTPADACVIEVGLGGRLDATNVLTPDVLAACGIATLGLDHERFLLAPEPGVPEVPMARIAFEKAGIAKRDVPLVTLCYEADMHDAIAGQAERAGAVLRDAGRHWHYGIGVGDRIGLRIDNKAMMLPAPALAGDHQYANCALAAAMIRYQNRVDVPLAALSQGALDARWPARLQRLGAGPLTALVPGREIWLDGGHNANAGAAIAAHFDAPLHLVLGMIEGKDPRGITAPLEDRIRSLTVVPVPDHACHPASAFGPSARAADTVEAALRGLPADDVPILIVGSLYLAGAVLAQNESIPQ